MELCSSTAINQNTSRDEFIAWGEESTSEESTSEESTSQVKRLTTTIVIILRWMSPQSGICRF